jgi:hypothetical protein
VAVRPISHKKEFKLLRRATAKNPSCLRPCDLLFFPFFIYRPLRRTQYTYDCGVVWAIQTVSWHKIQYTVRNLTALPVLRSMLQQSSLIQLSTLFIPPLYTVAGIVLPFMWWKTLYMRRSICRKISWFLPPRVNTWIYQCISSAVALSALPSAAPASRPPSFRWPEPLFSLLLLPHGSN